MLKLEIIIRPERISQVTGVLDSAGCTGYNYVNVTGRGRQGGVEVVTGRGGQTTTRSVVPKTLITTVISGDSLDAIIEGVIEAARTPGGSIGDGKIFISEIKDVVRISSGERGDVAI